VRLNRQKKVLVTMVCLGTLLSVAGAGTLASFTAQTTNPTNTFTNGSVTMTNVAGTVIAGANCAAPTANGTCATLFGASNASALKPGAADISNSATITYTGNISPTSDFRLYVANYNTKTGSSAAACTAVNPASKLDLQVSVGTGGTPTIIYPVSGVGYGTLDGFATTYTTNANGLQLKGGAQGAGAAGVWATSDVSQFNIKLHLDTTADNTYQGCQSVTDLVWWATQ
jgi:predicted ribosomally synthesized peptide with SipW-like signal peptide